MRKIYLDCGANKGTVTWEYILAGNHDFEYFMFEGNKELSDRLQIVEEKYPKVKVNNYHAIVWDEDLEDAQFFLSGRGHHGSTAMMGKTSNRVDYANPQTVKAIKLDKFIKDNFSKDDYIILKMDIEGGEYRVLPDMIEGGSMDYVNEFIIEFHPHRINLPEIPTIHAQLKEHFETHYEDMKKTLWNL